MIGVAIPIRVGALVFALINVLPSIDMLHLTLALIKGIYLATKYLIEKEAVLIVVLLLTLELVSRSIVLKNAL